MPDRIVISDASTIIGLTNIESLHLLSELYEVIEITSVVLEELGLSLPEWIKVNDDYNQVTYRSLVPMLDAGEASSIALALENPSSLLIIDERKGRKYASELGLRITGVTGVIIRAKNEGFLQSGKEKLDELINQGFRLSRKIYELALVNMNEG